LGRASQEIGKVRFQKPGVKERLKNFKKNPLSNSFHLPTFAASFYRTIFFKNQAAIFPAIFTI